MSTLINLIENLELTPYGTSSITNSQNKVVLIKHRVSLVFIM